MNQVVGYGIGLANDVALTCKGRRPRGYWPLPQRRTPAALFDGFSNSMIIQGCDRRVGRGTNNVM